MCDTNINVRKFIVGYKDGHKQWRNYKIPQYLCIQLTVICKIHVYKIFNIHIFYIMWKRLVLRNRFDFVQKLTPKRFLGPRIQSKGKFNSKAFFKLIMFKFCTTVLPHILRKFEFCRCISVICSMAVWVPIIVFSLHYCIHLTAFHRSLPFMSG